MLPYEDIYYEINCHDRHDSHCYHGNSYHDNAYQHNYCFHNCRHDKKITKDKPLQRTEDGLIANSEYKEFV